MKYLKKFNENSDDEKSIEDWCKEFDLKDYTINDNGTVDVDSGVDLYEYRNRSGKIQLEKIPIKFGIVCEFFDCSDNNLNTLEGSPLIVNGNFWCSVNYLDTLEGGPIEVYGDYYCEHNNLISLEGGPKKLGRVLYCSSNPISDVYTYYKENCYPEYYFYKLNYNISCIFKNVKDYFDSFDYNYLRGTNIIKHRFEEACEEAGVKMPESIKGYKYI